MLELKKITKTYNTGGFKQTALKEVSISFRESEFAAILGPSGSGKTTLLNIIGGLDHYDSGELIINGTSTKKYKDRDWDSYRNHRVGFVFQSYNLINHQTILSNVKLALTLSGISKKEANKRAKKALIEVGLGDHINKRPNQLSGGQMQRVAIARALVNDPDILLADEPTGALDSETSVQIMKILKKISKKKLVIMVTHNPDLANEYANRIINIKDGEITADTNKYKEEDNEELSYNNSGKTNMSFLTALALSFNNLMTKKGRTILVAFAGSIGIIGIALILAVSTGFQNYVDSIQEDTLTSYPLMITQESTDIAGLLLAMQSGDKAKKNSNIVKEQQFLTNMFSNIKSNDLKSFNNYLMANYDKVEKDLSSVSYSYSIDPYIYTIDSTNKLSKLNPNNLFSSVYSDSITSSFSSMGSIYSQMVDDQNTLDEQYNVLAGRWPKKYNEMIIVLSEPNSISDLLVYSLGLRDNKELTDMVTKIMAGESVDIKNKPLELTYDDLLNLDLRLIEPSSLYRYNSEYNVYEDMSKNDDYMNNLYKDATRLKIVGIVSAKEGTSSTALAPGVNYRSDLIKHIINNASETEIVKKQLGNTDVDVLSNKRFDDDSDKVGLDFQDIITIDKEKLSSAFNINIDQNKIERDTTKKMMEINNSINIDTTKATNDYKNALKNSITDSFDNAGETISLNDVDKYVDNNLSKSTKINNDLSNLEKEYVVPKDAYKQSFSAIIKGLFKTYVTSYAQMDPSLTTDPENPVARIDKTMTSMIVDPLLENAEIIGACETMGKVMTEAKVKKNVMTQVGELVASITANLANAFNVDQQKIAESFQMKLTEEELTRIISAMMTKADKTAKNNLINFGYQDLDEPTYISFYFTSFDGKEHFLDFIDNYNKKQKKLKAEDKEIRYTDTTGILMNSVKTIVNAVSYVLIAFVSISLIVSSIMIGIITYISVYERTKEIGILRAIGASKKNISSIFNAETFIIGLLSGLIGIGITYSLIPIINSILHKFTGNIPLNAVLAPAGAVTLVILSVILTLIGGLIPAKSASKRDPVEALRSE